MCYMYKNLLQNNFKTLCLKYYLRIQGNIVKAKKKKVFRPFRFGLVLKKKITIMKEE